MMNLIHDSQTGFLRSINGEQVKALLMPTAFNLSYADCFDEELARVDTLATLATEDRELLAEAANHDGSFRARIDVQQACYPEHFAGTSLAIYSILN